MKKILTTLLLCLRLTSLPCLADQAELRDFGLRIDLGTFLGVANGTKHQIGVGADFYCLSETIRMTFGTSLLLPTGSFPLTAVHYLGLEYNIPFYKDYFLLGLNYNKVYPDRKKGWMYYLGYKSFLANDQDLILLIGRNSYVDLPSFDRTLFIRLGAQWYF